MAVPTVLFLLAGGIVSDRHDRRLVMMWADGIRALAVAVLAVLVLAGSLRFWELVALVAIYGVGTAFFTPAFEAVVPDLLPVEDLPAANSLDQFVRPIALRLAGPFVGARWSPAVQGSRSASTQRRLGLFHRGRAIRPCAPARDETNASALVAVKEGLRFIRKRVWLWGTLARPLSPISSSSAPPRCCSLRRQERPRCLVADARVHLCCGRPRRRRLSGVDGKPGQPRRHISFMYGTWTLATLAVAGYGLATAAWQLMLACLVFNALETAGTIVWATVSSVTSERDARAGVEPGLVDLDRTAAVSFALTAPVAAAIGVRATLVGAAVVGATVTLGALFLPGMREIEKGGEPLRQASILCRSAVA